MIASGIRYSLFGFVEGNSETELRIASIAKRNKINYPSIYFISSMYISRLYYTFMNDAYDFALLRVLLHS